MVISDYTLPSRSKSRFRPSQRSVYPLDLTKGRISRRKSNKGAYIHSLGGIYAPLADQTRYTSFCQTGEWIYAPLFRSMDIRLFVRLGVFTPIWQICFGIYAPLIDNRWMLAVVLQINHFLIQKTIKATVDISGLPPCVISSSFSQKHCFV